MEGGTFFEEKVLVLNICENNKWGAVISGAYHPPLAPPVKGGG